MDRMANWLLKCAGLFSALVLLLATTPAWGTQVQEAWVARFDSLPGNVSNDRASAMALDGAGNVYVTGRGQTSSTYPSGVDYATVKYAPDGTLLWVRYYNGPANGYDEAVSIAVDAAGNVVVSGKSHGGANGYDYATVKYAPDGTELWVARYDGIGNGDDIVADVAVDAAGNVFVTGTSQGSYYTDYATVKYASDGTQLWVSRYDSGPVDSGSAIATALAVDNAGNVYVTGHFYWMGAAAWNYSTVKFDPDGAVVWSRWYNGPSNYNDYAYDIAIDLEGNVFVTGATFSNRTNWWNGNMDYGTVKYAPDGTQLWARHYNGSMNHHDTAKALAVDSAGYVYVTGRSLESGSVNDYTTLKYAPDGTEQWVVHYDGSSKDDAYDIEVDAAGNVYVTGIVFYNSSKNPDYATIKYAPDGTEVWAARYNGPGNFYDVATAMALDNSGNVYVTGWSFGGASTGYDYATIKYVDNQPPTAVAGIDQVVHVGAVATLDGSGSSDPDADYPLTYAWQITEMPSGSTATLSDSAAVNPSFTADILGDYTIELIVTDSQGSTSASDSVLISTSNTPPVADAGPDQAVILLGSTVQLDGTQSWDDDGDDVTYGLNYQWSMTSKPAGSVATLSNLAVPGPTFVADVQGDYVIDLVVSDPWASSEPDYMTVGFTNIQPVAHAGGNQNAVVGDSIFLNGAGSTDANGDPLTYSWGFVSTPDGSTAILSGAATSMASFTTDAAGTYVASLVVNDGFVDSDPSNASVEAISAQTAATQALSEASYNVNHLPPGSLKNKNLANAFTNKINSALKMIDKGQYPAAIDKLQNDILGKTDGCANGGSPDKNDWITTCTEQNEVYPIVVEAINYLLGLL